MRVNLGIVGLDICGQYEVGRQRVGQQQEIVAERLDIEQLHDLAHDTIGICQEKVVADGAAQLVLGGGEVERFTLCEVCKVDGEQVSDLGL